MAVVAKNLEKKPSAKSSKVQVTVRRSAKNGRFIVLQSQNNNEALKPMKTFYVDDMIPVIAHAVAVFGDEYKASHWLKTPLPILDNQSPDQLLVTTGGLERVEQILTRIEHNIPS